MIGTSSIEAALEELARHEIGVIVSKLQVGTQSIVPLLKVLKSQHPQVVTLAMTPFRDINVLVGLINQGQVFRFLPKPLRRNLLSASLIAAMARHAAMVSTPALQAAHRVESMKEASEVSMASRISPGFEPGGCRGKMSRENEAPGSLQAGSSRPPRLATVRRSDVDWIQ